MPCRTSHIGSAWLCRVDLSHVGFKLQAFTYLGCKRDSRRAAGNKFFKLAFFSLNLELGNTIGKGIPP
jgi:hypothetical protein